jgi:hypothetical protein
VGDFSELGGVWAGMATVGATCRTGAPRVGYGFSGCGGGSRWVIPNRGRQGVVERVGYDGATRQVTIRFPQSGIAAVGEQVRE